MKRVPPYNNSKSNRKSPHSLHADVLYGREPYLDVPISPCLILVFALALSRVRISEEWHLGIILFLNPTTQSPRPQW